MSQPPELSPADAAAIAALADGRLEPERRAVLEARLTSEPALAEALARQRAAVNAISAAVAEVRAPAALRARVEAMRAEAARAPAGAGTAAPPRTRRLPARVGPAPRLRRPVLGRWLPLAGLAAAAALVVALVVPSGGPTVGDALAAADRPPTAAVSADATAPALLRDSQDGVRFPNYAKKFGWRARGTRTDEIGGRGTRTVFYGRGGRKVAYTIVGGDRLPVPAGQAAARMGVQLISFRSGERTVVTWIRQGHTCVLSGTGVDANTLLTLASWKGKGAVRF